MGILASFLLRHVRHFALISGFPLLVLELWELARKVSTGDGDSARGALPVHEKQTLGLSGSPEPTHIWPHP